MYKNIVLCFYVAMATVTSFLDAAQPASARAAVAHVDPVQKEQSLFYSRTQHEQKRRERAIDSDLMAGYSNACRLQKYYDYPQNRHILRTCCGCNIVVRDYRYKLCRLVYDAFRAGHANYQIECFSSGPETDVSKRNFPCEKYDSFMGYLPESSVQELSMFEIQGSIVFGRDPEYFLVVLPKREPLGDYQFFWFQLKPQVSAGSRP